MKRTKTVVLLFAIRIYSTLIISSLIQEKSEKKIYVNRYRYELSYYS